MNQIGAAKAVDIQMADEGTVAFGDEQRAIRCGDPGVHPVPVFAPATRDCPVDGVQISQWGVGQHFQPQCP
jgi:hypothetical protein